MISKELMRWVKPCLSVCLLLAPLTVQASFIEATVGTAVVNDATATYNNPAALTLVAKPQIVTLGSRAYFRTQFSGQAIQTSTGFIQTGTSTRETRYYLPSFYVSLPTTDKITAGLAVLSNDFSSDNQDNSVLRYIESSSRIENIDAIAALGIKLNDYFALGAGLNFSYAKFTLEPLFGFPSLNIPDSQSRNESTATSWGGDVGLIAKPTKSTLIGLNYRSAVTYPLSGKSVFEGNPQITSNNYHFKFWTPARIVLSMNQTVTSNFGLIGTVQYIEWNIFKNITIYNFATPLGILPQAIVPQHLHNSWVFTLGSYFRPISHWIIRPAISFVQSPANSHYQISNGDSIVLGASMGYEINKIVTIDGSYAHAFMKNKNIYITNINIIDGVNKGFRDSVSLKLTFNLC